MNPHDLSFLQPARSVLSDRDIRQAIDIGYLIVKSPTPLNIQAASIDLHLAPTIMVFKRRSVKDAVIDLKKPVEDYLEFEKLDPKKGAMLHPHEFILGVTSEYFELPNQLIANVEGKSSLGRLGLVIHATAGFIDPGFKGHITLEITNLTEFPLVIYPGMPIGQTRFTVLTSPSEIPYGDPRLGSKKYINPYSEDPKPIASQYWKNFPKDENQAKKS